MHQNQIYGTKFSHHFMQLPVCTYLQETAKGPFGIPRQAAICLPNTARFNGKCQARKL